MGAWFRALGGGAADGCDRCRMRTESPETATMTYPGLDQPTWTPDGSEPADLYTLLMDLPFDAVLRMAAATPAPAFPADLRRCA